MTKQFFEERGDQSVVKARIVQKYFVAWANIIVAAAAKFGDAKIAYIDLYAGPGRYKDGAASTPLLVLEKAIESEPIRKALVALFNDRDQNNSKTLEQEIAALPGIEKLKHKPIVNCNEVGADAEAYFSETKIIPSFTFFDPFGYKGLSLKLINGVIKDWGCDCVFFFNYNRINAGLSNPMVKSHLDALFGVERAESLRGKVENAKPAHRQEMVLEELSNALIEMGAAFVLPFRFKNQEGRLTHHLVFVSKSFKGYEVMKEIMAKESSTEEQGVSSFAYSPADETMPFLFEFQRPLDELGDMLTRAFSGQTISMRDIYCQHSVGRPYLSRHYKEVLGKLEEADKIKVTDPEGKKRRKNSFADRLLVTFLEAAG
ncbi:three-Cys-motif partner protein TcmP [Rhodobacter capsulatus]|uniref:three-Cys-motif partner protein TcmP n=1 Tax=Rhodobacter capsulatus TaxID=1061 RepID=UPI0009C033C3|nr:three-Cys-motif partner protein TcmP [Rhodobacter capsulatus]PZX23688.1 three-Cys-motif partner protein [Rhodobacter capsulatus]QNR62358.1 three-Cys-motif partner protein TcmP [Rhodobacter capsulatus]